MAGDVEFRDDGVVHYPVNRRGGGQGDDEDALPLWEGQVGRDTQRPAFVAFRNEGEEDLGLLVALGQVAQVVQKQEVGVVQLAGACSNRQAFCRSDSRSFPRGMSTAFRDASW